MITLATVIQSFFTDRLVRERDASPHTIASYRDTIRLLLVFASKRTGKQPTRLTLEDLDATLISAFLDHLQRERGCSARTRNLRLTAIRSLFRYCALRHPEHAALIERVLAIPPKLHDRALVTFLTEPELDALLDAPDRSTWTGRRDHALLLLGAQTGLRASELIALTPTDIQPGTGAHVTTLGKGRKRRITPLTKETIVVLDAWITERAGTDTTPLFPTRTGRQLTRDALARRLTKYSTRAAERCPSLHEKNVTPHVLRHTAAMRLLHAGIDTSVIALWLGHEQIETTQGYLHADLAIKEQALAKTKPLDSAPGRYRPPDALLNFLEGLG
ncbi:MAG TPA: tyrosine-type recombinase/integrase [Solirubrobacterales bacterium]|nr:tyrosine-type recombinase/integrase [Solirubrobacterales bacterium]